MVQSAPELRHPKFPAWTSRNRSGASAENDRLCILSGQQRRALNAPDQEIHADLHIGLQFVLINELNPLFFRRSCMATASARDLNLPTLRR
jgi:hypothetical protein